MISEKFEFVDISDTEKEAILNELGYEISEEKIILNGETKKPHICPLSGEKIYLSEAAILPGSTLVIKATPATIAEYISQYIEER